MILVEKGGHLVGGLPIEARGRKLAIPGNGVFDVLGVVVKADGGRHFCEFMVKAGARTIEGLHPLTRPFNVFAPGRRRLPERMVVPMPAAA